MELKESHIVACFLCILYLFSACGDMNGESFPIGAYGKWQLGINLIWTKECFCLPKFRNKIWQDKKSSFLNSCIYLGAILIFHDLVQSDYLLLLVI